MFLRFRRHGDYDAREGCAMWKCEKCGKENPDQYRYCIGCGSERPRSVKPKAGETVETVWKCRYCGTENSSELEYCYRCGISRPQVSHPEEEAKAVVKRKHTGILISVAALFILGSIFLSLYKPIPTPPKPTPKPTPAATASPEATPLPPPAPTPKPTPTPTPAPADTAPPEADTLPPEEQEPDETPPEGTPPETGTGQTAAVGASSDQELVFTYSGGSKSLLLSFDPETREILYVRSLSKGVYEFSYEFVYLPDGRLATITRQNAEGKAAVTREVAYTDDVLSVERRIVPGRNDMYTDLAAKKNYTDTLALGGHTVERVTFPRSGEGANIYTLSVWGESLETGSAKAADREIFRICFGADGRAQSYTYCWRNEIAAFSQYEQFAEETHLRDENGNWYHFATLLTLKDKTGKQTGLYQRLLDDPAWKES